MTTKNDSLEATGKAAADALIEMVEALECDYDRLADTRSLIAGLEAEISENPNDGPIAADSKSLADLRAELAELLDAAGECKSRDDAELRIQEDALSVEVRSGWYDPGDSCGAISEEFNILLSTGGPAVRIRGELDEHTEPRRAWLEVQDWGIPWTRYYDINQETLLTYARCFYFGEG